MEKLRVSQVAKELGITPTAVYKKIKTGSEFIQNQVVKENGMTLITHAGVDALKQTMAKPLQEKESSGSEAVKVLVERLEKQVVEQKELIVKFQQTIDLLLNQHSDERRRGAEERARADTIIMKLSQDMGHLQKALEEKREVRIPETPPKVILPWEPEEKPDPLKDKNFIERLFIQTFSPSKLRKYDSDKL